MITTEMNSGFVYSSQSRLGWTEDIRENLLSHPARGKFGNLTTSQDFRSQPPITCRARRGKPDCTVRFKLSFQSFHKKMGLRIQDKAVRKIRDMDEARASKRRKIVTSSLPGILTTQSPQFAPTHDSQSGKSEDQVVVWSSEQDYERKPRFLKSQARASTRLPIKTAEGAVEQVYSIDQIDRHAGSKLVVDEYEQIAELDDTVMPVEAASISSRQQVMNAKEELARVASQIIEDPEENIGSLRTLSRLSSSSNPTVKKLGLATQLSVFRDIIPGYRVRPRSETDPGEKLSKDIRKLRNFEQSLLSAYQIYLKDLSSCVSTSQKKNDGASSEIGTLAITCACTLLLAVPHFNLRRELINIIIDRLGSPVKDADFARCLDTLADLFRDDDDGKPSFEAVGMLSKMIKAKHYRVDESILSTFLHLRLLSEFSSKASTDRIDDPESVDEPKASKKNNKKEFRTKRQRKLLKEQGKIDKEFKEADAVVDIEHRDQMQAETLKLVFSTYFRILKAEERNMIGPVLEGLAKFSHLINQDFFGDLLEVLKDLIRNFESLMLNTDEDIGKHEFLHDVLRPLLLCIRTAFALLEGQDVVKSAPLLGIDLTYFIKVIYRYLHLVAVDPDLELSNKKARFVDPGKDLSDSTDVPIAPSSVARVNVQTTSVLFLRAITAALSPRSTPPIRLAAFTKQLYTMSLHLPEKTSIATMGLLNGLAKTHTQKIAALWNTEERKGDGRFDPERADIEGCNPFASTIWEGELLKHHFCPALRDAAKGVAKITARTT